MRIATVRRGAVRSKVWVQPGLRKSWQFSVVNCTRDPFLLLHVIDRALEYRDSVG